MNIWKGNRNAGIENRRETHDTYSFNTGTNLIGGWFMYRYKSYKYRGSGFNESGSGSSILAGILIRIWIQCLDEQNWKTIKILNLFIFFWSKIANYLCLSLHKGRPSQRRSLHPTRENIQHFETWNFSTSFFLFLWVILPSWIRIWNTAY